MAAYYLMAQLPSLDGVTAASPLPITQERFYELCDAFLDKKSLQILHTLTLIPEKDGEEVRSSFVEAWNCHERLLRLALAHIRAEKMGKTFDAPMRETPLQILRAARTAAEMDDPMAAEHCLQRFRLEFLETLRPADAFCTDAVFYYAVKLKLLTRIRLFDMQNGRYAYYKIYDTIVNTQEQEAENA